ncbi:acetylglutamate kinase [Buchnera aphidicola (Thelaxes californica)]|uniref:Acetylglutamate kinase n=1 Tax=Buchnera aphidicola (Thelaxes californica) TaxID=1315998 RepID=A0A4D6YLR0_9GAMM|nr:acetylglutamate kinase [Buchnera aphidicola]QCI26598.1 acetylglutamate kinase [Buchnera aphidicola (Thelaxes californica)]
MNNIIIKFGGIFLKKQQFINNFFSILNSNQSVLKNKKIIIIHGGGCLVDDLMNRLSIPIKKKEGIRITDENNIDLITGVLSGTANKIILSQAKKNNINAVGLCLSDGDSVIIKKTTDVKLGYVGIPHPGNPFFLQLLCQNNLLPIINSIGITKSGNIMNVNADLAATALACSLNANLIFLSDVSAVLDGKGKRIKKINQKEIKNLIQQGIIQNGMIIKVQAALNASIILKKSIEIASYNDKNLDQLLFKNHSIGTTIIP